MIIPAEENDFGSALKFFPEEIYGDATRKSGPEDYVYLPVEWIRDCIPAARRQMAYDRAHEKAIHWHGKAICEADKDYTPRPMKRNKL